MKFLGLNAEVAVALQAYPKKYGITLYLFIPRFYRLYEVVGVYDDTLKKSFKKNLMMEL